MDAFPCVGTHGIYGLQESIYSSLDRMAGDFPFNCCLGRPAPGPISPLSHNRCQAFYVGHWEYLTRTAAVDRSRHDH